MFALQRHHQGDKENRVVKMLLPMHYQWHDGQCFTLFVHVCYNGLHSITHSTQFTVRGGEPNVTHCTSWHESTGECSEHH